MEEPAKSVIQIRIDSNLKNAFSDICEQKAINASALIRNLITDWVASQDEDFLFNQAKFYAEKAGLTITSYKTFIEEYHPEGWPEGDNDSIIFIYKKKADGTRSRFLASRKDTFAEKVLKVVEDVQKNNEADIISRLQILYAAPTKEDLLKDSD